MNMIWAMKIYILSVQHVAFVHQGVNYSVNFLYIQCVFQYRIYGYSETDVLKFKCLTIRVLPCFKHIIVFNGVHFITFA
jgi:hypothetical protein